MGASNSAPDDDLRITDKQSVVYLRQSSAQTFPESQASPAPVTQSSSAEHGQDGIDGDGGDGGDGGEQSFKVKADGGKVQDGTNNS